MPFIEYTKINFHPGSRGIIDKANKIINDWMAKGYTLTLRQIYYRFIALDWFPETWIDEEYNRKHGLAPRTKNTIKNYKRLGELLVNGRLAGKIDWDAMEDRTRNLKGLQHWRNPQDAVQWLATQYRIEKWNAQQTRIEVWIEKDALQGIFERVCCEPDIDVSFFSCRGYNSESEMWGAAQRILYYEKTFGQQTIILQFSDHDPSGLDMFRDIRDRLRLFQCGAVIKRLALTIAQVRRLKLPPNPAKETDIRFAKYVEKYGPDSWELDALEPDHLARLVREAVLRARSKAQWAIEKEREAAEIKKIERLKKSKILRTPKKKK